MDNRWTSRIKHCMNVVIHYSPIGLVSGRTRNISLQGMFVELPNIYLGSDEDIEISFSLPYGNNTRSTCVKARVIHSTDKGVGLKLHNFQISYF